MKAKIYLLSLFMVMNTALSIDTAKEILTVKGDIFIVPTMAAIHPMKPYDIANFQKVLHKTYQNCDAQIYVWATSDKSSNWSHHGHKQIDNGKYGFGIGFPCHLPAQLFKDKKEGEAVEFDLYQEDETPVHLILTLAQTKYRYDDRGPFHDFFNDLVNYYEKNYLK